MIVLSTIFNEHVEHLRTVLRRLREHGVKLKQKKCKLFNRKVTFLGRVVSEEGYRIDPENLNAVASLKNKTPQKNRRTAKTTRLAQLLPPVCTKFCPESYTAIWSSHANSEHGQ